MHHNMAWELFSRIEWMMARNIRLHMLPGHFPPERNYSNLEREALALVFGVKKFHQYIYGRHFSLVTDHKPLESLFNEKKATPPMAAARIQRWALTLAA